MNSKTIDVVISQPIPNVPENLEGAIIGAWEEVDALLNKVTFKVEDPFGGRLDIYKLSIDVKPIISLMKEASNQKGGFTKFRETLYHNRNQDNDTAITIELSTQSAPDKAVTYYHAAAVALQQLYLVLNIAVPGSCQILDAKYIGDDSVHFDPPSLDAVPFIDAYLNSVESQWPSIKHLEIANVWHWLEKLETSQIETAIYKVNKVLFGLLELGHSQLGLSNSDASAVYSLLKLLTDTPHGENIALIRSRTALIVGPATEEGDSIGELYRLKEQSDRGEHPYRRQPLKIHDYKVGILSQLQRHNSPVEEGLAIVLTVLQKLCVEDGRGYQFVEQLVMESTDDLSA